MRVGNNIARYGNHSCRPNAESDILLGKRAWWLPGWLDRIVPHVSIEGEEYFARLDAERAKAPVAAGAASD